MNREIKGEERNEERSEQRGDEMGYMPTTWCAPRESPAHATHAFRTHATHARTARTAQVARRSYQHQHQQSTINNQHVLHMYPLSSPRSSPPLPLLSFSLLRLIPIECSLNLEDTKTSREAEMT